MTPGWRCCCGSSPLYPLPCVSAPGCAFLLCWPLASPYPRTPRPLVRSEEGRPITPNDYLETALRSVAGSTAAVGSKNEIRSSIKAIFPDRGCFALVRPMNDEKELQSLDEVDPARMRPEFRSGLDSLLHQVLGKATPKRIGADVLSGPALASLAVSYVQAINDGAVPAITTTWQSVAEGENRAAAEAAEGAYAAAFDGAKVAPEEPAMAAAHAARGPPRPHPRPASARAARLTHAPDASQNTSLPLSHLPSPVCTLRLHSASPSSLFTFCCASPLPLRTRSAGRRRRRPRRLRR